MVSHGAGGIVGRFACSSATAGKIENCYNEGEVKGVFECGGIAGDVENIDINSCENKGEISSTESYASGGIVGTHWSGTINITNCANEATIGKEGIGVSGGIFGGSIDYQYNTVNIYNCYNKGSIASNNYCGGIAGNTGKINIDIQNCYSTGNINGKYPGGLVRMFYFK